MWKLQVQIWPYHKNFKLAMNMDAFIAAHFAFISVINICFQLCLFNEPTVPGKLSECVLCLTCICTLLLVL